MSLHVHPAAGVVPVSAEVLPQPGRNRQGLHLQVWHQELQQGIPFHVLCSPKTALPLGRGDLEFCCGCLRNEKTFFFFFFSASPANASPPMLFKVTTATLDLGLYHVKWSCVRWGVPTSRHSRWSRNKFRFQMRPKAFKGDAAKSLIFH